MKAEPLYSDLEALNLQNAPHLVKSSSYFYCLTTFILEQLYMYSREAIRGDWQLGDVHKLWDALLTDHKRIRILAPRDHLKTFYFSVAYVLWFAWHNDGTEVYLFSKTDKQAIKILDQIKRAVRANPDLAYLAKGKSADFWTKTEIRFSNGSTIYAQGYGTAIRGAHPKLIVCDDVIDTQVVYSDEQNQKAIDKFFADVLPLAEPDTQIIIVGTIQREDDLYHSLDPSIWKLQTYSAIVDEKKKETLYPEKWTWDDLMLRKKEISFKHGEKFFLREYCNLPAKLQGDIIKKEWIKTYRPDELPEGTDYIGWDLATGKAANAGTDFTAACVFRVTRAGDYYIRHVYRARISFGYRLKKIVALYADYPTTKRVRIEKNTFQNDTVQLLIKQTSLPIEGIQTWKNKEQKFREELAPLFENGKVYILDGAAWGVDFINELLSLPQGEHDDQADAFLIGKSGIGLQVEPQIRFL